MEYCYKYPRPTVTVDCIIFRNLSHPEIVLIRRANEPFKGLWATPGGFIELEETLEESAQRELFEETGLKNIDLQQLYTFGDPKRDPRHRTITIAFVGIDNSKQLAIGGDDASEAKWFSIDQLPPLAFDHDKIIQKAIEWLKNIAVR